ncbi:MAG: hypothetical protein JOY51_03985 [Nevskia sp.]|nr:hypothetical protein [Nevskia sp.]
MLRFLGVGYRAPVLFGLLLPCAAAWALSVDGRSQIHAVIGQPLAVAVPVSFAGVNPSQVTVRVAPGPDLPDEEELVAASVQAVYDPEHSLVRLSTPRRVLVPTLNLHLMVSAGSLVVNQDIDVLVDVPDLNAQHFAAADAVAPAAAPGTGETQTPGIRVLTIEKPAAPARRYGDSAERGAGTDADAERPSVTPPPPPPPPDPRPKSWQVKPGETLSGISRNLAAAYHVAPEPMSLALYEANSQAFSPRAPEQAIAGRRLQVPEDVVVAGEPAGRVAQFRAWLRQPLGAWQLRSFPSLDAAPAASSDAPWWLAQTLGTVVAAGLALLLASTLLKRLRLRRLVTRYVPMSAVQVKKVRRIIIPAPPPRRGLSQGTVTEKLRIKRLREMLDHNPFRSDIRYRLAERLHKAGDGRTFAQIAPPLRPSLSPEAWGRICKMGRELLPDDPRFQN